MRAPLVSAVILLASVSGVTAQEQKPAIAAQLRGESVTLAEVEKAAAGDLMNLEVQRQKILDMQLDRLIATKVVALEAKERGLTESELVQREVYAKAQEPSVDEIESYYQASKDLMKDSQEKAVPRIRQALLTQRRQKRYLEFVEGLKVKYQFKSLLEPVRVVVDSSSSPARGPAAAPVTIIEFSDFECPYCAALSKTLDDVTRQYPEKVRVVFRNFPLERVHANAMKAAEASACAAEQGKFWEMHDQLFKGGSLSDAEIEKRGADAGLKAEDLRSCLAAGRSADRVREDIRAGTALGLSSTPSFFINGRPMRGSVPRQEIVKVIDEELRGGRTAASTSGGAR